MHSTASGSWSLRSISPVMDSYSALFGAFVWKIHHSYLKATVDSSCEGFTLGTDNCPMNWESLAVANNREIGVTA